MPNSFRIKTEIGVNKVLPVKLDQQFDTLEILSFAVFPNDIYTRSCSDFGVLCGRVFANRGFGIANARVSVFIPLEEIDETNPIISTLYPYKRTEDVNEDGYKYNLLPYTQSHSGHVPVGTFPERIDALTNKSVIEVYDKYYKFTAKTNESGDFMIFGLPIGQHNIFMQVDLSDIGEFSLTPQDLIRMGRATETQIDGVKFKFSENYSELPQIVTLEKTIQVAPFYGEKDICDHYIVRTDFDLTTEAGVEFKPTSVFMGSIISHNNRKKLKKRCKVPAKAGWLCDLIAGPGQIESIRQTIFNDSNGRPILEEFTLENSGKVIDDNGTWVLEVPMNLDYVYTNEDGKKVLSDNPNLGVPTSAKYRFKVKWNQSPKVGDENKRGYFLVPNVKEWGWVDSNSENVGGSVTNTNWNLTSPTKFIADSTFVYPPTNPPTEGPRIEYLPANLLSYFAIAYQSSLNVESFKILINDGNNNYIENPDYKNYIPLDTANISFNDIRIEFTAIDPTTESKFTYRILNEGQFKQECSYTFSLNWADYGTQEMIDEAVNCEDRFYQMTYNKVYTVSQLIDRFAWQTFPQKAIEIKHITETKCEGNYNPFPANDVYYRYDIMFLILSFIMNFIIQPVLIAVIVIFHVLAWLFDIFLQFYPSYCNFRNAVRDLRCRLSNAPIIGNLFSCPEEINCAELPTNPFKNLRLGLFLYTDDGCERCKCNISDLEIPSSNITNELVSYNVEFGNTAILPDFTTTGTYELPTLVDFTASEAQGNDNFYDFIPQIMAGGSGNLYDFNGLTDEQKPSTFLLPFATDALYGGKVLQFSPNLPLGEKLNLFNTKMKYFDNPNNLSPGSVGWSQIKVTWWPELNQTLSFGETNLNINYNYTAKINNENVWIMVGDYTFLQGQTIYIYNNTNSVENVISQPFLQVIVNDVTYVPNDAEFPIEPVAGGIQIGGGQYAFTILELKNLENDEIVPAPISITEESNYEFNPIVPDFTSGIGYICGGGVLLQTNGEFFWQLGVCPGQQLPFALLNSSIYLSKDPTFNPNLGGGLTVGPLIYYTEDNPGVDIILENDTEVIITEIEYVEGQDYPAFLFGLRPKFTLKLPTGQTIHPRGNWYQEGVLTGYSLIYKKSTGNLFSWSTEPPAPTYDTYHFDNCLVLLIEDDSINTGDLFTFQAPSLSQDPNAGKPVGQINETIGENNFIEVKYCDPNYAGDNVEGNLTTTYVTPIIERQPWNSPFKRDLEYFQAISVVPFSSIIENRESLNVTGNNRFSLPWRFLDSSYGKSVTKSLFQQSLSYGCYDQNAVYFNTIVSENLATEFSFALINPNNLYSPITFDTSVKLNHEYGTNLYSGNDIISPFPPFFSNQFSNDFRIYRNQISDIDATADYSGLGGYNTLYNDAVIQYSPFTRAFQLASPPNCANPDPSLIGGTTDIWSTIDTTKYRVVFFQRGVDPHSPKLRVRYDLSRLYGYENYGANNDQFVVDGEYRMNIPIQGRNGNPGTYVDMKGLSLPKHCMYNYNYTQIDGQKLFYPSYLYSDNSTKYSGDWTTNLHTYYSALDYGAYTYDGLWGNINDMLVGSFAINQLVAPETPNASLFVGGLGTSNGNVFNTTFEIQNSSYTVQNQGVNATNQGYALNNTTVSAPCQPNIACTSNIAYGPYGIGYDKNHFADIPPLKLKNNSVANNVSGYWNNEYVEGASLMYCVRSSSDKNGYIGKKYYFKLLTTIDIFAPTLFTTPGWNDNSSDYMTPSCINECEWEGYQIGQISQNEFEYISPTYRTVNYVDNDEYLEWANSAHTINMSSPTFIVFRSDRLPTSTTVSNYNANGLLMHQNNTFAVYVINDEGIGTQEGGYELPDQSPTAEIDYNELPSENQAIIESLTNCAFAVNLNSYDVDNDGNPYIKLNNPFSIKENETYFIRNMGCYNFVSVPFKSLKGVPDRFTGGGGDIASAVEWTRRTVLNFSLCFEIYSHTFSNNWINGTLYHFPFQLNTLFDSNNEPVRDYCRHVIYFHEPNQTFYYRSSPWNGTDFIGKENPGRMLDTRYGNDKQLMYPTTILDMGPKNNYLQELVYSDEYDGYIISKIPTTTFNNVTDLLNIFVLSRLVNTNFLQQLIPTNASGNNEGSDDPSVTGFFKNTRWANGEAFFNNLLPSVVDADYSQMLSINSEFGVKEYGPEVYTNNDIWFINDNNGNSVFGITLKSDNQERDYISPRRTIWNDNSPVPPIPGDFTQIPVNTQKVPAYQWVIRYQINNTANDPLQYPSIFGMQSNDFWTNAPDPSADDTGTPGGSTIFTNGFFWNYYQRLDRFNDSSEYFKTDVVNITKYYRAHIINYKPVVDAAGNVILDSLGNVSAYIETANAPLPANRRYAYTFGAPFHFYFGLIQGASAMDRFRTKYVDTNIQYE